MSLLAFIFFLIILHSLKYSFFKELNIHTTKVPYVKYLSIYNSWSHVHPHQH